MLSTTLIVPLELIKLLFFSMYAAATAGVILGVYWEGDQFPRRTQHRGRKVLIASLAVDTFFTILVFGVDGWISAIQRGEIIALEDRLAARSLSDGQVADLQKKVRQFAGQSFQIIPYWQNKESMGIANRIADALIGGGWQIDQPKSFTGILGVETGIHVAVDKSATQGTKDAAQALVAALNDNGVETEIDPENENPNPTNKLSITVGIKP